ncbi:MAG: nucleoside-triphosphatase [Candidatus Hodarchaeales archaeon]|jgi:nucleoside-triphosphatase THEP1
MITKNIFIRGKPRSGKTTLIKEIVNTFPENFHGFYTNEVRKEKERVGFDVVNLKDSYTVKLARIGNQNPRIGKYTVFVDQFDHFISKCFEIDKSPSKKIWIIDEIGKMELLSKKFVLWIKSICFSNIVIATLPYQHIHLIDEILNSKEYIIFDLNVQNRKEIKKKIMEHLRLNLHKI